MEENKGTQDVNKQEQAALLLEYNNLQALMNLVVSELEKVNATLAEIETAEREMEQLKEGMESLVPLGPVMVKATLHEKVLVPIGSVYYIAYKPDEAKKKLEEMKSEYLKTRKVLESKLNEITAALRAIEGKLAELQRGSKSAGTS